MLKEPIPIGGTAVRALLSILISPWGLLYFRIMSGGGGGLIRGGGGFLKSEFCCFFVVFFSKYVKETTGLGSPSTQPLKHFTTDKNLT